VRWGSNVHVPHVSRRYQGHGVHNNDNISGYWGSCGGVGLKMLTQNIGLLRRFCGASPLRYGIRIRRHALRRGTLRIPRKRMRCLPWWRKSYSRSGQTNWTIWAGSITLIMSGWATQIVPIVAGPRMIVWVTFGAWLWVTFGAWLWGVISVPWGWSVHGSMRSSGSHLC